MMTTTTQQELREWRLVENWNDESHHDGGYKTITPIRGKTSESEEEMQKWTAQKLGITKRYAYNVDDWEWENLSLALETSFVSTLQQTKGKKMWVAISAFSFHRYHCSECGEDSITLLSEEQPNFPCQHCNNEEAVLQAT